MAGPQVWSGSGPARGTEESDGTVYQWTVVIEQQAVGELFDVQVEVSWGAGSAGGEVVLQSWLNDYKAAVVGQREERQRSGASEVKAPAE